MGHLYPDIVYCIFSLIDSVYSLFMFCYVVQEPFIFLKRAEQGFADEIVHYLELFFFERRKTAL